MRFNFHLAQCASSNTPVAKAREGQRMACVALGMHLLGHDTAIVDVSPEFQSNPRWAPFEKLLDRHVPGVDVCPAEVLRSQNRSIDVGFKCSVGIKNDGRFLNSCRVLMAHEYDPDFASDPHLLPVPFMVHDSMMDVFLADGLFEAFVDNDLDAIRAKYCRPKTGLLGMKACRHPHRSDFCEGDPEWTDLTLYEYQPTHGLQPWDFIPWITQFKGGLCLPGTTPKTNLPSLLALLGVAIVSPPFPTNIRDTPPISERNAIIFQSWEQVKCQLEDESHVQAVVAQASKDYVECWSPKGQARLLAEKFL